MMAVVMIRRHTARAHAEGGEGLNLQSAALTKYMVVKASCRQVFFGFSYHGQMNRRTALARAILAAPCSTSGRNDGRREG